jgi:hypothetical protein
MAKLILEHPHSGIIKQAPVGYSWTTLCFPALPALFRWDMKGFVNYFSLCCWCFGLLLGGRDKSRPYVLNVLRFLTYGN